ncbi:MAG: hypothetical protein AAGD40_08290 [Pseudomonadota bacterium]
MISNAVAAALLAAAPLPATSASDHLAPLTQMLAALGERCWAVGEDGLALTVEELREPPHEIEIECLAAEPGLPRTHMI